MNFNLSFPLGSLTKLHSFLAVNDSAIEILLLRPNQDRIRNITRDLCI